MIYELVLRREAQIDLNEIFMWYEEQQYDLGFKFLADFENTMSKIQRNPLHASFAIQDARGTSLKRFPYEIIYRVNEKAKQVRIIAVLHQHRNPDWFKERIHE